MRKSIFYYKELTPAEVGKTGTHEVYVRLPNYFDYKSFFHQDAIENGSVLEINFSALDITNGRLDADIEQFRFVYFANSNKEKRLPGLGPLFKKYDIQSGDIFFMESREENGRLSFEFKFIEKGSIMLQPSQIYFSDEYEDEIRFEKPLLIDTSLPLQQIFYGAPGTGKSHEIKKLTKGESVIRTTFHPDSDYSTFVGCYKPIMGDPKPIYGFDSSGNTVKATDMGKEIPEQKIEYKFVKQAFLKAYIEAWKKQDGHTSSTKGISFSVGTATYTILSVDDKGLQQSKTEQINRAIVERVWEKLWDSSGNFEIPTGPISGESVQQAISKWIYDNIEDCKKDDFTDGWEKLTDQLKDNEIEVKKDDTERSKKYTLSWNENKDSVLFSADSGNTKDRIQKCYEGLDEATGVEKGIIGILNNYGVDNFDDAWKKLREEVENSNLIEDTVAPQFLIIEEINRGNCAQIFGDIFQLLDRQDNGFSEYPIEADSDLQEAIAEELQSVDIKVDWALANYKSSKGSTLSEDIKAGRILLLPNNLYIWATMNTSDQSLFPMDSAFKRRWDWKCVPIDYENKKSGSFIITIDGKPYCWHVFLKAINKRIKDVTQSEDKQMGNFFIKESVDETQFINKVMFYLWNDICKDEYHTKNNFFRNYIDDKKTEKEFTFNELFGPDAKTLLKGFMEFLDVSPDVEEPQNLEEEIATDSESA